MGPRATKRSATLQAYLSGGMEYADGEGALWRSELHGWIEKNLAHHVFNPNVKSDEFLSKHYAGVDFRQLRSKDLDRYRNIVQKIIELDCTEIARRSDYVVCYWDESAQRGAGTKGELTIARYFQKPVYLVTGLNLSEIPSWVLGCASRIFDSFSGLKQYLLKEYRRNPSLGAK